MQYSFFEHLSRCSFCHAVFNVQRTPTEFKIYLKYISVLYSKNDVVVYSKWYGKLATTLFYLAIVCSLLINEFNFAIPFRIDLYLFYLALLATVFAFVMYSIYFKFNKKES